MSDFDGLITGFYFSATKSGSDIALVKLATLNGKGIVFGDVAQPICMPSSETAYKPGTWCSVSGWGMQKRTRILSSKHSFQSIQLTFFYS